MSKLAFEMEKALRAIQNEEPQVACINDANTGEPLAVVATPKHYREILDLAKAAYRVSKGVQPIREGGEALERALAPFMVLAYVKDS